MLLGIIQPRSLLGLRNPISAPNLETFEVMQTASTGSQHNEQGFAIWLISTIKEVTQVIVQ